MVASSKQPKPAAPAKPVDTPRSSLRLMIAVAVALAAVAIYILLAQAPQHTTLLSSSAAASSVPPPPPPTEPLSAAAEAKIHKFRALRVQAEKQQSNKLLQQAMNLLSEVCFLINNNGCDGFLVFF
jgi:hypothetical protein